MDDQALWQLLRTGSEEAYSVLAQRYYAKLVHYGQKFTPNRQLVEDALQDLLIRLWLGRQRLSDTPSVKFYLLKAFRHQLFKSLNKSLRHSEVDEADMAELMVFSVEDQYIELESDLRFTSELTERLTHLPTRQREVIYLRFFQGLTIEEIADLLVIQTQSVSNLLQRALTNLRSSWFITTPVILALAYRLIHLL